MGICSPKGLGLGLRRFRQKGSHTLIMENQMEKKMENKMETGIIGFLGNIRVRKSHILAQNLY